MLLFLELIWAILYLLGKGPTEGLDNTTLTAEKMYSTNFIIPNKKFCLKVCIIMMIVVIYLSTAKKLLIVKSKRF